MSSFTINQAVIGPLRYALYSQIGVAVDALDALLVLPEREHNPGVRDAYHALRAAGDVLDRIGWLEQQSAGTLTLSRSSETRLILDALEVEWGIEIDQASSARSFGEEHRVAEAEQRCAAVRDAASAVETAGLAADLLDTDARDA